MNNILDSLGNPLEEGKYYELDFQPRVQYIGASDSGSVFNFKPPGRRVVVRTLERLQAIPPVRLGNEAGDETDDEYENPIDNKDWKNNIYASDSDTDDEDLDLGEVGGKRRRKKTRRHRKKTRKYKRKTRKHRKKSRKHRKR
jgi:hypothetical protein